MLEANALHHVGKLDIDAEVVRVELELVAFGERLIFLDVHRQRRYGSIDLKLPVPVLIRRRLERNRI